MKKHTSIYLAYFGYDISDCILCEICQAPAKDIHHINARGMGGSKEKDVIENLMALCRTCHNDYGDIKELKDHLIKIHTINMKQNGRTKPTQH